ncbi:MAG: hypothetical protein Unbinned2819contig1000_13 [Prokaryotic dsDNA virus sp.]|nr:MAG: hypothetical protein Unbinned2819contig1000_13 [Prokaryotic dsDNA virus sp.]
MKWTETHCKHGHEWTDANTYLYLDGKGKTRRKCRACTLRRLGDNRANLGRIRKVFKVALPPSPRDASQECIRVNRLTALQEQLERETRTWMRPEIKAQIEELKNASYPEHGRTS